MAQGDFGGDASVMWNIDVDNLRPGSAHSTGQPAHGNGKHHQDGIDEVDANQYFNVSVKMPSSIADKNMLANALQAAAQTIASGAAGSGIKVTFPVPIEPYNYDQIQIHWNSSTSYPIKNKALTKKVAKKR